MYNFVVSVGSVVTDVNRASVWDECDEGLNPVSPRIPSHAIYACCRAAKGVKFAFLDRFSFQSGAFVECGSSP